MNKGKKLKPLNDTEDVAGYAVIESTLSASGRSFTLTVDSSVEMSWTDALLALSDWLEDEAKKITPR